MLVTLVQIDAWDAVSGATVALRASSVDDSAACHLNGQTWWPAASRLPTLRYDFFDGAFGGQITAPSSSMTIQTEPLPALASPGMADARIRLWTGELGATWAGYTLLFDGRVTGQPQVEDGKAQVDFAVDDRWLDTALLATYAGTTGAEGPASLKGQPKPLALGAPRYVAGTLIDAVNSVFQVSAYGAINGFEAALERLLRYGAPVADYPTYDALVAATVQRGQWATAKAVGMARFGAPPTGQISFLIQGDKAGPDGWARSPGQLIRRIALLSGGAGKIDDASLNALDVARPYPLSLVIDAQTTARQVIQQIAASLNAVAGVSWSGKLFVRPVGIAAPTITLATDGSSLPAAKPARQIDMAAPWKRLAIEAERAWTVHALADIAFTATLVDMGAYSPTTTYREGNIVQSGGATWVYINPAPSSGNTPPDPAYWNVLAQAGGGGAPGLNNATVTIYQRATSAPALPTAPVTYTFANGGIAGLNNGWTANPPGGTNPLYVSVATASASTATDTIAPAEWASPIVLAQNGSDGTPGANGFNSKSLFIYQRAASAPGLPTGPATYVFSSQTLSYLSNGWQSTIPTGTLPLWVTTASALSTTDVDTISPGEWASPSILSQNGTDGAPGLNNAAVTIYQRAASPPPLPSAVATYTFASGAIAGLTNGWSANPPAGSSPLYVSVATASAAGATDTIGAGEWASPVVMVQDGTSGSSGVNSKSLFIYQRAASAPGLPTGPATYIFSTQTLSYLSNGWQSTIPAGTLPIWVSTASALSTTDVDTISPGEWATPAMLAQNGSAGTDAYLLDGSTLGVNFAATYDGVLKPGQISQIAKFNYTVGGVNVSASTSWSLTFANCTASIGSDGTVSFSAITANGYVEATGTYSGVTRVKRIPTAFVKDSAPPNTSQRQSVSLPGGMGLSSSSYPSTTPVVVTIAPNSSGQINATISLTWNVDGYTGGTKQVNGAVKVAYRIAGSSSGWTDFSTGERIGGSSVWTPIDKDPGGIGVTLTQAGLSVGQAYDIGLFIRLDPANTTPGFGGSVTGSFTGLSA